MQRGGFSIRERIRTNQLSVEEAIVIVSKWVSNPASMKLLRWLRSRRG